MKQVNIIAAVAKNRVLGAKGAIPWTLPQDLKRFKELTQLSTVVMGRKTWESLPVRPLRNRDNIVVSRSAEYYAQGAKTVSSLHDAIKTAVTDTVWVIGGAQIYEQALPLADKLYLTEVNALPYGDAYFPQLETDRWALEKCEYWKDNAGTWHRYLTFEKAV